MKQFILAQEVGGDPLNTSTTDGMVGVYCLKNGDYKLATSKADLKHSNIVLVRSAENGGNIVIPFHYNSVRATKAEYAAGTPYEATFTVPNPSVAGDYSVIIVRKGEKFNYRNKWTATYHLPVKSLGSISNSDIAEKLAEELQANNGHKAEVTVSGAVITVKGVERNSEYEVLGADELMGVKGVVAAPFKPVMFDGVDITDLANKAAADAGFEYTFRDAYTYLYPNYPISLAAPGTAQDQFVVFTFKFNEPRVVATHGDSVNQIVQIAVPVGSTAISHFDNVISWLES